MKDDRGSRTGPVNIIGHGNVIGDNSSSKVNVSATAPRQQEALALLDEFIRRLAFYENSLRDAHHVRQNVIAARKEIARSAPKWDKVRNMLRGVATGVAGVAALADLINNALSIVKHL
jgi:hypothetical protein